MVSEFISSDVERALHHLLRERIKQDTLFHIKERNVVLKTVKFRSGSKVPHAEAIFEVKLIVEAPPTAPTKAAEAAVAAPPDSQEAREEVEEACTPSNPRKNRAGQPERQDTVRPQTLKAAGDFYPRSHREWWHTINDRPWLQN